MDNDDLKENMPFLSGLAPVKRPCGAKTRAGTPCKKWAVRGKNRCRNHGGLSTGPKTLNGRLAIRLARLTHGRYTIEALKTRTIRRIRNILTHGGSREYFGLETVIEQKILAMSSAYYLCNRGKLIQLAKKYAGK